jgi:hypothetical protein
MIASKLFFFLLILLSVHFPITVLAEEGDGPLTIIRSKYETLSPKGKFAAGCTLGFVGSRIAVNTAVNCLKVGAAAFITYV